MHASPTIAFLGLSHLGIVSAAAAAAKGFTTIGVDLDHGAVAALQSGRAPIREPQLDELIETHRDRLSWTTDLAALSDADLVILSRDVPTDDQGRSSLGPVLMLLDQARIHLRPETVLTVLCQAPPGFTRKIDRAPSKLFYLVETLIFGRAVERALHPERHILGCADPQAAPPAPLQTYLEAFDAQILPMRYESAELAKISINCCLVASISTANTLAEVCEGVGADWAEIVPALKLDARIGPAAYLKPGLGLAGGNLERDLANVVRMAGETGAAAGVVAAQIADSAYRKQWAARRAAELLGDGAKLGVLGLAYKENTASVKNSPAIETIALLLGPEGPADLTVSAHDPQAEDLSALAGAGDRFARVETPAQAAADADALAVLTPWPHYRDLDLSALRGVMRGELLIDPYAVFDAERAAAAGLSWHTLGRAPQGGL
ncbi:MAG: nucleotide sugar dehydrogenase [Neomegalonema sp.]|nr:nucleotide sugar dehydrogenase [Neomegalonema sp.]